MAKSKTQERIEIFIKALSTICHQYGMIIDSNSHEEGAPLILYAKVGAANKHRKLGFLHYEFVGENEDLVYAFDPIPGSSFEKFELEQLPIPASKISAALSNPDIIKKIIGSYDGPFSLGLGKRDGKIVVVLRLTEDTDAPEFVDVENHRLNIHKVVSPTTPENN